MSEHKRKSHAPGRSLPAVGASLLFEGEVYAFQANRKAGHLTFGRQGEQQRGEGFKTVTLNAREVSRSTGTALGEAVTAEFGRWLRALPPDPDVKRRRATTAALSAHADAVRELVKAAGQKQFYHLVVDGEPDRMIQPPIERPSIRVKKTTRGKAIAIGLHPGGLTVAPHPPAELKEG